jgi:hypothetical protein
MHEGLCPHDQLPQTCYCCTGKARKLDKALAQDKFLTLRAVRAKRDAQYYGQWAGTGRAYGMTIPA